jgi:Recombination endonuclease VII
MYPLESILMFVTTVYGEEEAVTHYCRKCKQEKPLHEFSERHRGIFVGYKPYNQCKECEKKDNKERNKAKKYNAKPTDPDYCCPICERAIKDTGYNGEVVLDHDHKTGEFRGWICHDCNNALARTHENTKTLRNMIAYLEKYDTN